MKHGYKMARRQLADAREEASGVTKESLMQEVKRLKVQLSRQEAEHKILNTRCLRAENMVKRKSGDLQRWHEYQETIRSSGNQADERAEDDINLEDSSSSVRSSSGKSRQRSRYSVKGKAPKFGAENAAATVYRLGNKLKLAEQIFFRTTRGLSEELRVEQEKMKKKDKEQTELRDVA